MSMNIEKHADRIAQLTLLILPYSKAHNGCLSCGENTGKEKQLGAQLEEDYEKLGLPPLIRLKKFNAGELPCYQPYEILICRLQEFLNVKPVTFASDFFNRSVEKHKTIEMIFPLENLNRDLVVVLKEAFAKRGLKLVPMAYL